MSDAAPPSIVAISGPLLIGYLFNWGLLGVLSVQVYFYHLAFSGDRRLTKALVALLYVLELAQTILLTHDAFATFTVHFADISYLNKIELLPFSIPMFSGIVGLIVQMYYAHLLRVLSGSRLLGMTVAVFSVLQCSAAIVDGTQAFIIDNVAALATKTFVSETIWCAGSVACDLIIAVGMISVLMKKDTGLPVTHAIITKLVRVIVETGCLTAIAATIQMALFISLPATPYFTCVGFALSKLYSNSLLAILNSRIRVGTVHDSSSQPSRTPVQPTRRSSLTFHGKDGAGFHPAALPYTSGNDIGPGSRVVDVHIHSEAWTTTDSTIPAEDSGSEKFSPTRTFDSVSSKV